MGSYILPSHHFIRRVRSYRICQKSYHQSCQQCQLPNSSKSCNAIPSNWNQWNSWYQHLRSPWHLPMATNQGSHTINVEWNEIAKKLYPTVTSFFLVLFSTVVHPCSHPLSLQCAHYGAHKISPVSPCMSKLLTRIIVTLKINYKVKFVPFLYKM